MRKQLRQRKEKLTERRLAKCGGSIVLSCKFPDLNAEIASMRKIAKDLKRDSKRCLLHHSFWYSVCDLQ